jgi:hypothetical protein
MLDRMDIGWIMIDKKKGNENNYWFGMIIKFNNAKCVCKTTRLTE